MDLDSIMLYLKAKGMNAREIHNDLIATLGTKVPSYSTVTRWPREAQLGQFSKTAVDFTEEVEDYINEWFDAVLNEKRHHNLFLSANWDNTDGTIR
jgi:hypothetical protein